MAEKNNGARRRRAFADFKENQYNEALYLSAEKKRKKTAKTIFKWIAIVLITAAFIVLGFVFTDALMNISEKEYEDTNTYTPVYVNTTTAEETTEPSSEDEENTEPSYTGEETDDQFQIPENN